MTTVWNCRTTECSYMVSGAVGGADPRSWFYWSVVVGTRFTRKVDLRVGDHWTTSLVFSAGLICEAGKSTHAVSECCCSTRTTTLQNDAPLILHRSSLHWQFSTSLIHKLTRAKHGAPSTFKVVAASGSYRWRCKRMRGL